MRSKPAFDGSIPSGNSVAVYDLLRLYHYTERADYLDRAEATLRLYAGAMREQPFGFANMLCAVDFYTQQPREIVVVGNAGRRRHRRAAAAHPADVSAQPDAQPRRPGTHRAAAVAPAGQGAARRQADGVRVPPAHLLGAGDDLGGVGAVAPEGARSPLGRVQRPEGSGPQK